MCTLLDPRHNNPYSFRSSSTTETNTSHWPDSHVSVTIFSVETRSRLEDLPGAGGNSREPSIMPTWVFRWDIWILVSRRDTRKYPTKSESSKFSNWKGYSLKNKDLTLISKKIALLEKRSAYISLDKARVQDFANFIQRDFKPRAKKIKNLQNGQTEEWRIEGIWLCFYFWWVYDIWILVFPILFHIFMSENTEVVILPL